MSRAASDTPGTQATAGSTVPAAAALPHLQRLEAESIHILREVVAECERPVMLYSVGKDSAVMLQLAVKAFYPAPPPFPLLHVDTTWKFRAMYEFRDRVVQQLGMQLLVHVNPEGLRLGMNPFTHGSQLYTDVMKTQALKQALDKHKFDAAFGGARRDEEKSRAKERIFSFRSAQHRWDPKNQRPELWNLYNMRVNPGESIRVFPLSNWTELDVWQYIYLEKIPVVPLYFAKERPVVERDGTLILFDDHLAALARDSKKFGTQGDDLDFALLVDGLAAEREQGITIDVAYRFFSTDSRKYIVADTPGHEQYTRNMVTGASTADAAIILVDARNGVLTQTRRHTYLVSLLGIRHVALAINKMDLVDYSQARCEEIEASYREFAKRIGLADVTCIPMSALKSDNIVAPTGH